MKKRKQFVAAYFLAIFSWLTLAAFSAEIDNILLSLNIPLKKETKIYFITCIPDKECVACNKIRIDQHFKRINSLKVSANDIESIIVINTSDSIEGGRFLKELSLGQQEVSSTVSYNKEVYLELKTKNKIKYEESHFYIYKPNGKLLFKNYIKAMDGTASYARLIDK